ncbi:MAG: phosphomannomutase/phosphoglucomutase [bacterium]
MAGIFKAYDIRGIYGENLTEDDAFRIGRAFCTFLKCRNVVIGQDMRVHSQVLFDALARGCMTQGANVIRLGLCSTPMSYYANGHLKADASIMITASHNTREWNGFKLCREKAIPISGATGIADIERIVKSGEFAAEPAGKGVLSSYDIGPEYSAHVRSFATLSRPVRVAADFANAMGIMEAKSLEGVLELDTLFDTLDGSLPNHEANPLKTETLDTLRKKVAAGRYDFGVAFDGDADRAGFVDEKGAIIPMDIITALIAQSVLKKEKGVILYDLRSSWAVKEIVGESGGIPMMCRVGHAFIKQQMREAKAVFAGELSGHYYFRDNFYTESSAMATLAVANVLAASDKPLSELVRPIRRYVASGEINSEVQNAGGIIATLRSKYGSGRIIELDGLSIEFDDWWFNVRTSNTEPLMRLNLEAKTQRLMESRRDEILQIIRK